MVADSLIATRTALKLADFVVTEAGFGADLGAEKFLDIKCRKAGLSPSAAVVVATVRALKMHGGVAREDLGREDLAALRRGMANLGRHVANARGFGVLAVVAISRFRHRHRRRTRSRPGGSPGGVPCPGGRLQPLGGGVGRYRAACPHRRGPAATADQPVDGQGLEAPELRRRFAAVGQRAD
jgi:hypothetical protein